jgi:hypothetical protein
MGQVIVIEADLATDEVFFGINRGRQEARTVMCK